MGRSTFSRTASFRADNLGQNAVRLIGNIGFSLFVAGVVIFTVIAATYEPIDPLFHPSDKITTFLTSTSNATLKPDDSVVKTGEDFMAANQTVFSGFINITDVETIEINSEANQLDCDITIPVDCKDPEVFHLMIKATIEKFKDIHFYKFGKAATVEGSTNSCDMAWRYRPKDGKTVAFYKDYRRFVIEKSENCSVNVIGIGEYHSGVNARKRKKSLKSGFQKSSSKIDDFSLPLVGEAVNDSLPVMESENAFKEGKYLVYMGGGERCKSMNHFLWSFLCALGEAQYLNRTLVLDLSLCLSSVYTVSGQNEEGKDFRFYFDFEHLKEAASLLDQVQFWADWGKWYKKNGLNLHLVEDFRVTPMKLVDVRTR